MTPSERISELAAETAKRRYPDAKYPCVTVELQHVLAYLDEQHEAAEQKRKQEQLFGKGRSVVG
jgi:hypothetical protein